MSEAQVAGGMDRLPWLADDARGPPSGTKKRDLLPWAIVAVLLVAAVSFWLGTRTSTGDATHGTAPSPPAALTLPAPRPAPSQQVAIAPQPEVAPVRAPEVRQTPAPQVRIVIQPRRIVREEHAVPRAQEEPSAAKPEAVPPAAPPKSTAYVIPKPWPPRVTAGAYGRLVQIGAYGSRLQAKQGWAKMVRAYPAVARLPALVVESRNSRARSFYRFQIGTTSQAHSEVLCQRMQKIGLSCAIIGLPWKAKVER